MRTGTCESGTFTFADAVNVNAVRARGNCETFTSMRTPLPDGRISAVPTSVPVR